MLGIETIRNARLLIVDDQEANVLFLTRLLQRSGYVNYLSTTDPLQALPLCLEYRPDLVLLDLHMPYLDGFAVLELLRSHTEVDIFLPVLVLTADATSQAKQRALQLGANDFLAKPFDITEVMLRVKNLVETRILYQRLQDQNHELEGKVRDRTQQLEAAHVETLERLARAVEFRDDVTGQHTQRVGEYSGALAAALGLHPLQVELIRMASPLHDLGKLAVPDAILLKPDRLTDEEFAVIRTHTTVGARLLAHGRSELVQLAESIALTHHERWDGRGYPRGIAGEDIPLAARIVSVTDVFDALVNERPYKQAWTAADALAEIDRQKGKQFDPQVADAFIGLILSRGQGVCE